MSINIIVDKISKLSTIKGKNIPNHVFFLGEHMLGNKQRLYMKIDNQIFEFQTDHQIGEVIQRIHSSDNMEFRFYEIVDVDIIVKTGIEYE